jgi:1-acyl-sn-glycerol-3-phosphate acyltransferase
MVIVPPYCGLPRLSHQFPVVAVVIEVGWVVVVEVGWVIVVEVGWVIVVVVPTVDVVALVVVLAQDAKTSDVTMRQVNTIQIAPLFI